MADSTPERRESKPKKAAGWLKTLGLPPSQLVLHGLRPVDRFRVSTPVQIVKLAIA